MLRIYEIIARSLAQRSGYQKHRLQNAMAGAPSGSGFDAGTTLCDSSTENRLVFVTSFHHMSEPGFYTGWTEHKVIITPNLAYGFDLRVTGRNKNNIKEYISDVFNNWLDEGIEE